MEVRARGSSGITDESEELTAVYLLARMNQKFFQMAEGGRIAVVVVNEYVIAIAAVVKSLVNDAIGGGVDIVSGFGAKVDAGMKGRFAIDRVNAVSEPGGDGAVNRSTEGEKTDGF